MSSEQNKILTQFPPVDVGSVCEWLEKQKSVVTIEFPRNEYVAGFLTDSDGEYVALILKNRPEWQAGKWNGIGGRIENGETPIQAMRREFFEETGLDVEVWEQFAILRSAHDTIIHWFIGSDDDAHAVQTMTDEQVQMFHVSYLPPEIIPNIRYLLDMAFQVGSKGAHGFEIIERDFAASGN